MSLFSYQLMLYAKDREHSKVGILGIRQPSHRPDDLFPLPVALQSREGVSAESRKPGQCQEWEAVEFFKVEFIQEQAQAVGKRG